MCKPWNFSPWLTVKNMIKDRNEKEKFSSAFFCSFRSTDRNGVLKLFVRLCLNRNGLFFLSCRHDLDDDGAAFMRNQTWAAPTQKKISSIEVYFSRRQFYCIYVGVGYWKHGHNRNIIKSNCVEIRRFPHIWFHIVHRE